MDEKRIKALEVEVQRLKVNLTIMQITVLICLLNIFLRH